MKKIIILFAVSVMASSCLNEFLQVDPVSDISSENYWKTEADAKAALTSIYSTMQTALNTQSGFCYMSWFEGRADNFFGASSGTYPMSNVNLNNIAPTHPAADWNNWYKAISTSNYALYYIPGMPNLTDPTRNQLLAEAYFLRAYCYFMLVRIWGDVPIVTKPTLSFNDLEKPFRSPKETVMNELILKDLEEACEKVNEGLEELYFFSAGALYALCTEVAMWNKNYDDAIFWSQSLINLKKGNSAEARYELVDTREWVDVMYKATTMENIWTLKWSFVNNGYNAIARNMNAGNNMPVALTTRDIWCGVEWEDDIRRDLTIQEDASYPSNHLTNSSVSMSMWKWAAGVRENAGEQNELYVPLYRLADILLLRAEALNRKGDYAEALDLLNRICTRAGLPERLESDYAGSADKMKAIEDDILLERRFELFGEGKRWFDLVRTGRAIETMNAFFTDYIELGEGGNFIPFEHEWQLYWPITPNNMIDNENLTQTGNY